MASRHGYNKGYTGNQAMCRPSDTGTDQTTGGSSPCHIYPKCHKMCHPINRQKLNEMIDALQRLKEDLNRLFNITEALTKHIKYQQMYINMCTILGYLRDSITYTRQIGIHTMESVDAAKTNVLSPDIPGKYTYTYGT